MTEKEFEEFLSKPKHTFIEQWKFVKECNQCGWIKSLWLNILIRRKDESKIIRGTVSSNPNEK